MRRKTTTKTRAKAKLRPKKRKKTSLRPKPFIVIFLVANVVAGLLVSKLTVIRKVEVEGAQGWDHDRLEAILQRLKGRPCAQINRNLYENLVMEDSAVRTANLDRNLFGSAVLTVEYHVPVARFYNRMGVAVSSEGVIFHSAHLPPGLPTIEMGSGEPKALLTMANDFPSLATARLATRLKEILPQGDVRIEYGTGNGLCLNIGTDQVILGSYDELDAKLGKLQAKLSSDPEFLSKIKTFNLLDPKNPMTIPK